MPFQLGDTPVQGLPPCCLIPRSLPTRLPVCIVFLSFELACESHRDHAQMRCPLEGFFQAASFLPAVHDPFSHLWTIALIFENLVEKST